jgi:hypothetical protein
VLAAASAAFAIHADRKVRVYDGVVVARGFVVADDAGAAVATLAVVEVAPGPRKPALHVRSDDGTGGVEVVAPRGGAPTPDDALHPERAVSARAGISALACAAPAR